VRTGREGFIQKWTSALFGAKNDGFFETYGVSARTIASTDIFRTRESQFFANLCGRLLWTVSWHFTTSWKISVQLKHKKLSIHAMDYSFFYKHM